MVAPIVEMLGIRKHFGHVIALDGVSFDVCAGECHCLLGDNGAGKSTFIKTMSGVHRPSEGEMRVDARRWCSRARGTRWRRGSPRSIRIWR